MKRNSHYYLLIIFLILIILSCNKTGKDIEKASLKICSCFSNYAEDDVEKMNNTIRLLDSVGKEIKINLIPHEKLVAQMQEDCPEEATQFVSLSK